MKLTDLLSAIENDKVNLSDLIAQLEGLEDLIQNVEVDDMREL